MFLRPHKIFCLSAGDSNTNRNARGEDIPKKNGRDNFLLKAVFQGTCESVIAC